MTRPYTLGSLIEDIVKADIDPTPVLPSPPEAGGWKFSSCCMSNFNRSITPGTEDALRAGKVYCYYYAYNFHAAVWWDAAAGHFLAYVRQHREHVDTIEADNLRELMTKCSDRYGHD